METELPVALPVAELPIFRASNPTTVILDVREPHELDIAHVEGALHIPMQTIPNRIAELPREAPLAVMCHHGARSMAVVNYLRKAGYSNAFNITGGIDAWSRELDSAIPQY
jgi:rhodanese-related sulfurtransferase